MKLGEQIVEGGGERKVYRITIVLDKKEIPAVLKTMTSEETKQEYENYQICKNAGLEVPSLFRVTEKGVVMSDMTDGGKRLVISINEINIRDDIEKRRKLDTFIKKHPTWLETVMVTDLNDRLVMEQLKQIIGLADNSGILVHPDCYFLVFSSNGELIIRLGDFGGIRKNIKGDTSEDVRSFNETMSEAFVGKAKQFQAALRERRV